MRLYLSSYQIGLHGDVLAGLVGGQRRGRVVSNALDGYDEERRRADTRRQIAQLAELGLLATDLDLRQHDPDTIADEVGEPDFLWIRGGNVFTARMAMARSGLDEVIIEGLRQDAFVYAGFSAGACVLAPSLAGLEHCDPVEDCIAEHGTVRYDGLGILDRPVVPHLESPEHPETALLGEVAARYSTAGEPFWGLRDGEVLVTDGNGGAPKVL
ncbi:MULTISPECIES: Type 1 glutamine amidotransferase-like domain-containing protein [Brachybacterium]|uniref:Type 1 glutamine amidotransferase-like domain-containing protein n=1 Tax=Brachybacterium TaxID=43668 RepID=UPI000DF2FA10|nr:MULTISPECIES: Type 1 glutamine amidotransferase-like domain-containing protein [Brachybacterium]RCS65491.1 peptidase [Brachybacterium sp. JB7]RCS77047.1 peptidase [Brachybacterium alimentarium]RCS78912.1 peptidase [Brachybacterium alimentarium]